MWLGTCFHEAQGNESHPLIKIGFFQSYGHIRAGSSLHHKNSTTDNSQP